MSRVDEDPEQAVRDLLQTYEKEEAAVLRAELIAFLKSPECRAELQSAIQKPVEAVVLSALTNAKFQEQLRDAVIASLKPEIVNAAQTAATGALSNIKVTITEEAQRRMRAEAEETLRNAFATAQKDSLATVPRLANEARRQMQGQEEWPAPRTAQGVVPGSSGDRMFWGTVAGIVLVVSAAIYWFAARRDERPETTNIIDSTVVAESLPTETAAVVTARPSALFEQYRRALAQMGPSSLPDPSDAQIACVETALQKAETAARLDVAALRASLNDCAATKARPSGASRIVAGVQAQLTEEARARTCTALQPVTIDGKHGNETSKALKSYVGCTAPIGVPEALETLGDYAAVGVYFIDKRMRDAGSTTQR